MSSVSSREIVFEFKRSRIGLVGITILAILVGISVSAIVLIPVETFQEWNNPGSWISFPKTSIPVWVNWFPIENLQEVITLQFLVISLEQILIMMIFQTISSMSFQHTILVHHYYKFQR